MRPWLEQMIDSNTVDGLHWVDKEKTMFCVPWKHAARHGWEMSKDASLFKEWAIHTGKYVEGQTSPDPKTWKANFRCAMNSLPDIEAVKDKNVNKGHGALRVFRMLPTTPRDRRSRTKATRQRRQSKVKYEESSSDSEFVPSPAQAHLPSLQDSHLDSTVDMSVDSTVDSTVKRELPDHSYVNHDAVPIWATPGFEYPRRFEVSPAHSTCPDDAQIIEICAQLETETEMWQSSVGNNGFLCNEVQCGSPDRPGSLYSEASSADELEELQYTTLSQSFSTTTADDMSSFYPFIH